jgi:CelD/BcsL family acetyltransferase involved in cellulose biosynthesis/RimJ/RimL family protein N-acetyltransferase
MASAQDLVPPPAVKRHSATPATLSVRQGPEAEALLSSEGFLAQWRNLFENCPWATSFQAPAFVRTWYRCYAEAATPLLALRASAAGQLDGLLTLAVDKATGDLVFAGSRQAEYHAWLAFAGEQTFIVEALERLRQLRFSKLSFHYLPTGCPLAWLDENWRSASIIQLHQKPLIEVRDAAEARESLHAGRTRKRINRMERLLGPTKFFQLNTAEELDPYLEQIIAFTDLRHGAVHGNFPFADDPNKRAFFRELMRPSGLMHTTLMTVGGQLASAQMNFLSGRDVLLGLTCHSPFLAEHSPGKLHILHLLLLLHQQGISRIDLTPGGDPYKERFANAHEQATTLTVFFSGKDLFSERARTKARSYARVVAHALRADRGKISRYSRLGRRAALHPVRTVRSFLRILATRLWSNTEMRFYRLQIGELRELRDIKSDESILRDSIQDLLRYEPEARTAQSKTHFVSEALSRIEGESHIYTHAHNGTLVHYGWLNPIQKKAFITEVGCEYEYPPNTAVMWDFYTVPSQRGKGLYSRSLRRILSDAAATAGTEFVYIAVLAENWPSRRVIEKVGFRYHESIVRKFRFGRNSHSLARLSENPIQ